MYPHLGGSHLHIALVPKSVNRNCGVALPSYLAKATDVVSNVYCTKPEQNTLLSVTPTFTHGAICCRPISSSSTTSYCLPNISNAQPVAMVTSDAVIPCLRHNTL